MKHAEQPGNVLLGAMLEHSCDRVEWETLGIEGVSIRIPEERFGVRRHHGVEYHSRCGSRQKKATTRVVRRAGRRQNTSAFLPSTRQQGNYVVRLERRG